jgi:hypothetical protein
MQDSASYKPRCTVSEGPAKTGGSKLASSVNIFLLSTSTLHLLARSKKNWHPVLSLQAAQGPGALGMDQAKRQVRSNSKYVQTAEAFERYLLDILGQLGSRWHRTTRLHTI